MPAPPLANTFESGQPDGTAISAANSGGAAGDAFTNPGSGAPTYSTTHAHSGTLSMRSSGSVANEFVTWNALGTITTDVYLRCYIYLTANPSTQIMLINVADSAGNGSGSWRINTSGQFQIVDAAGATISTYTATAVALNQWVRLEGHIISATSNGTIELKFYNNTESSTETGSLSSTTAVLGAHSDRSRFGNQLTNSTATWVDDVAVTTTGWIGSSVPAGALTNTAFTSFLSRG